MPGSSSAPTGSEGLLDPFRISRASGQPPAGVDGAVTRDGLALGSSIHGVFNSYSLRRVILEQLAEWKGASLPDPSNTGGQLSRDGEYDKLAQTVRDSLKMDLLYRIVGLNSPPVT